MDAAFLKVWQRQIFAALAERLAIPFVILDIATTPTKLRGRLTRRRESGVDASEADLAVLAQQKKTREPLRDNELAARCLIGSGTDNAATALASFIEGIRNS